MLSCLILGTLFVHSFGQVGINCSVSSVNPNGIGYNVSELLLINVTTANALPVSIYTSKYNNGSVVGYLQVPNNNPLEFATGVANPTNTNNPTFDCYANVSLNGSRSCMGYSVINFGTMYFATVGCFDAYSSQCPISCSPDYFQTKGRMFFSEFYLNNITADDDSNAKTNEIHQKKLRRRLQSVDCNIRIGYNSTYIVYNAFFVASVNYMSMYSNGSVIYYDSTGESYATGKYNVSQATSGDVQCNQYVTVDNGAGLPSHCISFSIAMNGTALVGCSSLNETCPTTCSPEFVLSNYTNIWFASLALNRLD